MWTNKPWHFCYQTFLKYIRIRYNIQSKKRETFYGGEEEEEEEENKSIDLNPKLALMLNLKNLKIFRTLAKSGKQRT